MVERYLGAKSARLPVDEAALPNQHLERRYNSREESIKGSITSGKLADFVGARRGPSQVDPGKILDIKIYRTVTAARLCTRQ